MASEALKSTTPPLNVTPLQDIQEKPKILKWGTRAVGLGIAGYSAYIVPTVQAQVEHAAHQNGTDFIDPSIGIQAAGLAKTIFLQWGPRTIVAAFAGYYGLGYAYMNGITDQIDSVAKRIFYDYFGGYAGVGAFMPSFQYYSAWGIRAAAAIGAAATYDMGARILQVAWNALF